MWAQEPWSLGRLLPLPQVHQQAAGSDLEQLEPALQDRKLAVLVDAKSTTL